MPTFDNVPEKNYIYQPSKTSSIFGDVGPSRINNLPKIIYFPHLSSKTLPVVLNRFLNRRRDSKMITTTPTIIFDFQQTLISYWPINRCCLFSFVFPIQLENEQRSGVIIYQSIASLIHGSYHSHQVIDTFTSMLLKSFSKQQANIKCFLNCFIKLFQGITENLIFWWQPFSWEEGERYTNKHHLNFPS